jgi:hypothetical protein
MGKLLCALACASACTASHAREQGRGDGAADCAPDCSTTEMLDAGDVGGAGQPGQRPPPGLGCSDADSVERGELVLGEDGRIAARLLDADPWPAERHENDWSVELLTADGQPLPGATITAARSFDPTHGLSGIFDPELVTVGDHFELMGLHFLLASAWEVQIWASAGTQDDFIVLPVCVYRDPSN